MRRPDHHPLRLGLQQNRHVGRIRGERVDQSVEMLRLTAPLAENPESSHDIPILERPAITTDLPIENGIGWALIEFSYSTRPAGSLGCFAGSKKPQDLPFPDDTKGQANLSCQPAESQLSRLLAP